MTGNLTVRIFCSFGGLKNVFPHNLVRFESLVFIMSRSISRVFYSAYLTLWYVYSNPYIIHFLLYVRIPLCAYFLLHVSPTSCVLDFLLYMCFSILTCIPLHLSPSVYPTPSVPLCMLFLLYISFRVSQFTWLFLCVSYSAYVSLCVYPTPCIPEMMWVWGNPWMDILWRPVSLFVPCCWFT